MRKVFGLLALLFIAVLLSVCPRQSFATAPVEDADTLSIGFTTSGTLCSAGDKRSLRPIVSIKVTQQATGKTYLLRNGSVSGNILWKHVASGSITPPADPVRLQIPTGGFYYQTDDSTAPLVILTR